MYKTFWIKVQCAQYDPGTLQLFMTIVQRWNINVVCLVSYVLPNDPWIWSPEYYYKIIILNILLITLRDFYKTPEVWHM